MTLQDISDRIAPCEYMNKSVTNIYSKMYYDDSGLIIIIE